MKTTSTSSLRWLFSAGAFVLTFTMCLEFAAAGTLTFKQGAGLVDLDLGINIVSYDGTQDSFIRHGSAFGGGASNYGGGSPIDVFGNGSRAGLMRFDVSVLDGLIGTDISSIDSVTLRLFAHGTMPSDAIEAYRLSDQNSGWREGTNYGGACLGCNRNEVTGQHLADYGGYPQPSPTWASGTQGPTDSGVDFDAVALGTVPVTGELAGTAIDINFTGDLTALISDWASGAPIGGGQGAYTPDVPIPGVNGQTFGNFQTSPNEGMVLYTAAGGASQFHSSETATPFMQPELIITYSGGGPACIVGDADCDGYVDVGNDIFAAFGNFTGPGSYGMTRIQGDVQGNPQGATTNLDPHDGDVDVSDIITMFSNFTGPAPPEDGAGGLVAAEALDSAIPDLIYDASTGEVLLDLDSAVGFTGYVLNSANGFITGNHTPFMAGVTTTLPYELAEATFGTPAGPYPKSIGQVFPSGMDMTALSAFLTGNQVSRGNNQPIVPFDLVIVNPVSSGVPEPAAVVMGIMALAGLGMVAYRRRR